MEAEEREREVAAWGRVYGELAAALASAGSGLRPAEVQALTLFPQRAYRGIRMRADALRCVSGDAARAIDAALAEIPEGGDYGTPGRPVPTSMQGPLIYGVEEGSHRARRGR